MPDMPGLAILLSKKKPSMSMKDDMKDDESDMDEAKESHSEDDTKHAVMSAFIKAVKMGDVEGALTSYQDLHDLCKDSEDDMDDKERY